MKRIFTILVTFTIGIGMGWILKERSSRVNSQPSPISGSVTIWYTGKYLASPAMTLQISSVKDHKTLHTFHTIIDGDEVWTLIFPDNNLLIKASPIRDH